MVNYKVIYTCVMKKIFRASFYDEFLIINLVPKILVYLFLIVVLGSIYSNNNDVARVFILKSLWLTVDKNGSITAVICSFLKPQIQYQLLF